MDPEFTKLPSEVLNIIKGNANNLDALEIEMLQRLDPFDIPDGEILRENSIEKEKSLENENKVKETLDKTKSEGDSIESNGKSESDSSDEDLDEPRILRSGKQVSFK